MRLREKLSWSIAGVLALFVVASLASTVGGGPLDPPGAPAPTLRSLDEVFSAWNQQLPSDDGEGSCASSRFTCVFEFNGVFDRETGLVWQRVVTSEPETFDTARRICLFSTIGGKRGWRLPTTAELNSLIDLSTAEPPRLPAGHPFQEVHPTDPYWTVTIGVNESSGAATRDFLGLDGSFGSAVPFSAVEARSWCVRGGGGEGG